MKLFYILAIVSTLAISVSAKCDCDVEDVACLQSCVQRGNTCISTCEDPSCFASCVDDHWPGPDLNYPYPESVSLAPSDMMASRSETISYATMMTDTRPTESTWGASSRPMASSSDYAPSSTSQPTIYSTFTSSVSPSFSSDIRPSVSGPGPVSSSTSDGQNVATTGIVSILSLGMVFYYLYLN